MELLVNPARTVYAVNCHLKGDVLTCGALYVEAGQPHRVIRLADNTAKLDVRIPDDLLDGPTAQRGWNVELQVTEQHEQVQHPL